ncbi:MAG: hypothetical protein KJ593_06945 [Candidatus Omnitrophica bacterium]|nr:hypothetical protein [Candidatus Omnitrophota bacterium]
MKIKSPIKICLNSEKAIALILGIWIILAFSVLGLLSLSITTSEDDIYIKYLNSVQAFYLAEAGRHYAYDYYLGWGIEFTDEDSFPETVTKNFGSGSFRITYDPYMPASRAQKSTNLVVQATQADAKRRINQAIEIPNRSSGTDDSYLIYGITGTAFDTAGIYDSDIKSGGVYSSSIIGSAIFQDINFGSVSAHIQNVYTKAHVNKSVTFTNCTGYIDNLFVEGPATITINGGSLNISNISYAALPVPIPGGGGHLLSKMTYVSHITKAENQNVGGAVLSGDLTGKAYYFDSALVSINGNLSGGPAIIVVAREGSDAGDISIANGVNIGDRITLVAKRHIIVGDNVVIGGTLQGSGSSEYIDGRGCFLHANAGDITVGINARIKASMQTDSDAVLPKTKIVLGAGSKVWGLVAPGRDGIGNPGSTRTIYGSLRPRNSTSTTTVRDIDIYHDSEPHIIGHITDFSSQGIWRAF